MSISLTTSRALFQQMETARISLYPGEASCGIVELSSPARLGVYNQSMSVQASDATADAELFDLVSGEYVLAVWGFDGQGQAIAFGCVEDVVIEEGERYEALITLGRYRP